MFNLIYADFPWEYNQRAAWQDTRFGGGVHSTYSVMTEERLFGLKSHIDAVTDKDCQLLMWAVWPKMDVAIDLIRAWDFKFSTRAFTWTKIYHKKGTPFLGPGASTASNDEVIISAYRGRFPTPAVKLMNGIYKETIEVEPDAWSAMFGLDNNPCVEHPHPRWPKGTPPDPITGRARSGKIIHSAKPEEFRRRIELLYPNTRKLEMFARVRAPGWTSIGLDLTGNDIYADLELLAKFGQQVRTV